MSVSTIYYIRTFVAKMSHSQGFFPCPPYREGLKGGRVQNHVKVPPLSLPWSSPKSWITWTAVYISRSYLYELTRIYEYLRKNTRILLVFLWFRAHFTHCELFEPVKSYGNDSAILKQSKNMLLNFELHRSTMNLHQKNVLTYALLS